MVRMAEESFKNRKKQICFFEFEVKLPLIYVFVFFPFLYFLFVLTIIISEMELIYPIVYQDFMRSEKMKLDIVQKGLLGCPGS